MVYMHTLLTMQGGWQFGLVVECWPQSMKLLYANTGPS